VGRLFTRISGPASIPGRAAVLWPSIFSTHAVYAAIADDLARDHLVVSIDPPGHGRSVYLRGALTLEDCARATFDLLDRAGISVVAWVGTSWGGLTGCVAASAAPTRVRHLTCLGTPFAFAGGFNRKALMIRGLCRFMATSKLFANGVAGDFFLPETRARPELITVHEQVFTSGDRRGLAAAADLIFRTRPSMEPLLPKLAVPTLVVAGALDRLYPVETMHSATAMIPDATFATLDAAHIAAVDRPHETAALLRSAWADTTRSLA
jgi:3-oxoadipate enol-lactonase